MNPTVKRIAPWGALALAAVLALPGLGMFAGGSSEAREAAVVIPAPVTDTMTPGDGLETAIIAGGCFWGVQGVYQHTEGVVSAISGYSGGPKQNPSYRDVTTGMTGHAESVEIKFDPKKISYGKILQIFFSVAHNPTQLNFQGPDHGTQYRSAIFFTSEEQQRVAKAYIAQLNETKLFGDPIVTEVTKFDVFWPAEDYHQDYAYLHPDQPYIAYNDLPKISNLRQVFPDFWREKPALVFPANAS